jgi:hypothetical protein
LHQHGGEEENSLGIQPSDENIPTNQGHHEVLMEITTLKAFTPLFEGCSTNMNCQPCFIIVEFEDNTWH